MWNKIIDKQTQSNPYADLQGCSKTLSRVFLCNLFNDCMIFHLLTVTVFPNSMAEQERYYIKKVLKKP